MAQAQRPNCGGYKTYETVEKIPYSERTKRTKKDIVVMTIVGIVVSLGLGAYFGYAAGFGVGVLCLGVTALFVILLPFGLLDPGYKKKNSVCQGLHEPLRTLRIILERHCHKHFGSS